MQGVLTMQVPLHGEELECHLHFPRAVGMSGGEELGGRFWALHPLSAQGRAVSTLRNSSTGKSCNRSRQLFHLGQH